MIENRTCFEPPPSRFPGRAREQNLFLGQKVRFAGQRQIFLRAIRLVIDVQEQAVQSHGRSLQVIGFQFLERGQSFSRPPLQVQGIGVSRDDFFSSHHTIFNKEIAPNNQRKPNLTLTKDVASLRWPLERGVRDLAYSGKLHPI